MAGRSDDERRSADGREPRNTDGEHHRDADERALRCRPRVSDGHEHAAAGHDATGGADRPDRDGRRRPGGADLERRRRQRSRGIRRLPVRRRRDRQAGLRARASPRHTSTRRLSTAPRTPTPSSRTTQPGTHRRHPPARRRPPPRRRQRAFSRVTTSRGTVSGGWGASRHRRRVVGARRGSRSCLRGRRHGERRVAGRVRAAGDPPSVHLGARRRREGGDHLRRHTDERGIFGYYVLRRQAGGSYLRIGAHPLNGQAVPTHPDGGGDDGLRRCGHRRLVRGGLVSPARPGSGREPHHGAGAPVEDRHVLAGRLAARQDDDTRPADRGVRRCACGQHDEHGHDAEDRRARRELVRWRLGRYVRAGAVPAPGRRIRGPFTPPRSCQKLLLRLAPGTSTLARDSRCPSPRMRARPSFVTLAMFALVASASAQKLEQRGAGAWLRYSFARRCASASGRAGGRAAPAQAAALAARRSARKRPCASLRQLARYRRVPADPGEEGRAAPPRLEPAHGARTRGDERQPALLAKRKTRRCGGGVKPSKLESVRSGS